MARTVRRLLLLVVLLVLVAVGAGALLLRDCCGPTTTATMRPGGVDVVLSGMTVRFPGGSLPDGTRITVRKLAADDVYKDGRTHLVGPVFDVDTDARPLTTTVEVIVPYQADAIRGGGPSGVSGALWDGQRWVRHQSRIDESKHTATFVVDHFTNVAAVEEVPLLGWDGDLPGPAKATGGRTGLTEGPREATFQTPHFSIEYATGQGIAPLTNQQYVVQNIEAARDGIPHYITDLGVYLEQAWARYTAMGYVMPPAGERLAVEVRPLTNPGSTGPWGPIEIDGDMSDGDGDLRDKEVVWRKLKPTAAHELFHVVQRYNPAFPSWFAETGAAFMEWKLFHTELPENFFGSFMDRAADFTYSGMWSTDTPNAYGKAAFLVFLQERYGSRCSTDTRDILKDGVMPSGLPPALIAVSGLPILRMDVPLLEAARRCGDFKGTWDTLFEEFGRVYLADSASWQTFTSVLPNGRETIFSARFSKAPEATYRASLHEGEGLVVLAPQRWVGASAAVWRVRAGAKVPLSTLVVELDNTPPPGTHYKVYTFTQGESRRPDTSSDLALAGEQPAVAIPLFGASGQANEVLLVGTHPGDEVVGEGATVTVPALPVTPRAYLLAAPQSAAIVPAASGRVTVSWRPVAALPAPAELPGAFWEVHLSGRDEPVARVAYGSALSAEIAAPTGGQVVTVDLVDRHGFRSPLLAALAALATEPAPPATLNSSVRKAMITALDQLGIRYRDGDPAPGIAGLQCADDASSCVARSVTLDEPPGRQDLSVVELTIMSASSDREAAVVLAEQRKDYGRDADDIVTDITVGGLSGFHASFRGQETDIQRGTGFGVRQTVYVQSGQVLLGAEVIRSCVSINLDNRCGSLPTVGLPTREVLALIAGLTSARTR